MIGLLLWLLISPTSTEPNVLDGIPSTKQHHIKPEQTQDGYLGQIEVVFCLIMRLPFYYQVPGNSLGEVFLSFSQYTYSSFKFW
jgi:hypothetical protein